MPKKNHHSLPFNIFKYSVYALLAFNILLFLLHGTTHEALHSIGWVILLGTFEYESTSRDEVYNSPLEKWPLGCHGAPARATWQSVAARESNQPYVTGVPTSTVVAPSRFRLI